MTGIDLRGRDIAVCDDFLTPQQVAALAGCAEMRRERGDFQAARIGAPGALERRAEIRGDSICWLTEPLFAPESELLDSLEELRLQLNRSAFLGLFESEWHYAWYPPGAGYARHVDQPHGRDQRRVSLVLYLNASWTSGDGGALRMFAEDGRHTDIEPLGGRAVAFLTERREHAVMPANRGRLSVTGWFRGREPPASC
jgi:SM-20-related protein